jgi:hypothetical protein
VGFWPAQLVVGNDLLVYAQWQPRGSPDGLYLPNICERTSLAKNASEDLAQLGRGRPPRKFPAHR